MEPEAGTDRSVNAPEPATTGSTTITAIALVALVMAVPLLVVLLVVAALVPVVPLWAAPPLALLAAAAVIWFRLRDTLGPTLDRLGARPADETAHARLLNLTQGLSLAEGVTEPELHVIDDPARNIASLAHRDRSAIIVTTGLLEALDRVSLEGTVAEALVRIGSGDAEAATLAAALLGPLAGGPLGPLLRPVTGTAFRRLLSEDRDLVADRAAVRLTRYPPGLLSALGTIAAGDTRPAGSSRVDQHLWMIPPSGASAGGVVPRAPLDLRMDILGEL